MDEASFLPGMEPIAALPDSKPVVIKGGPEADLWERHRSTITKLYVDQNKTLKHVMAIMQQDYGLKGTVKMYKNRITRWKLDKNCKAKEMKAIARKKVQRDAIGKASMFYIRGRPVDIKEVLRYFDRHCVRSLEEAVRSSSPFHTKTPSDIDCLTPTSSYQGSGDGSEHDVVGSNTGFSQDLESGRHGYACEQPQEGQTPHVIQSAARSNMPTVSSEIASSYAAHEQLLQVNRMLYSLSSTMSVPLPLMTPPNLLIPEMMLASVETFVYGSSGENSVRDFALYAQYCGKINTFADSLKAALTMLQRRLYVDARRMLSKACTIADSLPQDGCPQLVDVIFDNFLYFHHSGFPEAASAIFRYLKSVADISGPSALGELLGWVLRLNENIEEACIAAWKCFEDVYYQHWPSSHHDWFLSVLSRLVFETRAGKKTAGATESEIRSLLTMCKQIYHSSDERRFIVLHRLCCFLSDQERSSEAEEIGLDLLESVENAEDASYSKPWSISGLEQVAYAQYAQHKYKLARCNMKRCLQMAREYYGADASRTMNLSSQFERRLHDMGQREEAASLAAERERILKVWESI